MIFAYTEERYHQAMEPLRVEWDPDKADLDGRRHGVSFARSKRGFDDPFASEEIDDLIDHGVDRYIAVGIAGNPAGVASALLARTGPQGRRGNENMNIRPIRNDTDHRAALVEIDRLWTRLLVFWTARNLMF